MSVTSVPRPLQMVTSEREAGAVEHAGSLQRHS